MNVAKRNTEPRSVGILMIVAAATLACASAVHFGATIGLGFVSIHDPFAGAAIPEAVLAVILAAGALWVLARLPKSRLVGLGATAFAILVVLFGMSITIRSGGIGDVAYHVTLLVMLLIAGFLLVRRVAQRSMVSS
jgi:hypothetical protein